MEDYKSNSDKSKVNPKIEPVSGPVTVKKKERIQEVLLEALITREIFKRYPPFRCWRCSNSCWKKAT